MLHFMFKILSNIILFVDDSLIIFAWYSQSYNFISLSQHLETQNLYIIDIFFMSYLLSLFLFIFQFLFFFVNYP